MQDGLQTDFPEKYAIDLGLHQHHLEHPLANLESCCILPLRTKSARLSSNAHNQHITVPGPAHQSYNQHPHHLKKKAASTRPPSSLTSGRARSSMRCGGNRPSAPPPIAIPAPPPPPPPPPLMPASLSPICTACAIGIPIAPPSAITTAGGSGGPTETPSWSSPPLATVPPRLPPLPPFVLSFSLDDKAEGEEEDALVPLLSMSRS